MCGINGIFAYHYVANQIDRGELLRTRDHMSARGPDGFGAWVADDERLGLGHRRLSIIDLSDAGAQPMANANASLVVIFNGEIYNHQELRRDLEAKGYRFVSSSDTEVLLHLFSEKGEEMVHDLRGMFAFAIWDVTQRRLFMARDPLGIKPLYYADDGWTFRFASQVKALMAGGAISSDPDPAGWTGFYLWGSVPEPYTQYSAIRSLPAGCYLVIDALGARSPVRYYSVADRYLKAEGVRVRAVDAQESLRSALRDSVRSHMVSDVPIGVFLSAGIDSGALLGLMSDYSDKVTDAVTLSFEEFRGGADDEGPLAAEVAKLYGVRHTNHVVTRDDFEADLPRFMASMDVPSIDGLNSWFVSKAAAAQGLKVAISGLGGDELFGGYPSFRDLPIWVRRLSLASRVPGSGAAMCCLGAAALKMGVTLPLKSPSMLSLGGSYPGAFLLRRGVFMPSELANVMDPELAREGIRRLGPVGGAEVALEPCPSTPFGKVATLETSLYMRNQLLRDVDWAGMAHGVEVRVPLADATLLENVSPILLSGVLGRGKQLLAEAPNMPLPITITRRAKTGFATPIALWQGKNASFNMSAHAAVPGRPVKDLSWARQWAINVAQWH
jgi:asparagine synthase (glutamine-hydrolysing)